MSEAQPILRNEADVEQKFVYPLLNGPALLDIAANAIKPKEYLAPTAIDKKAGRTSGYYPDYSVWLFGLPVLVLEAKDPRRTLAPQAPPPSLYLSTYDPELAGAICRRVVAGESLRSICRADPSMPTGKTVWNWRRAHEEFRWMLDHAQGLARARALTAQAQADAARRAARAGARKAPGRTGRPSSFDEAAWNEVMARLMGGEGLTAICRDDRLPSVGTVYNWMRAAPERMEDYRKAKTYTLDGVLERHCEHLPWLGERKSWPMLHRAIRAGEKEAARLKLKRYAPPAGPQALTVMVEAPDGSRRVIYGGK